MNFLTTSQTNRSNYIFLEGGNILSSKSMIRVTALVLSLVFITACGMNNKNQAPAPAGNQPPPIEDTSNRINDSDYPTELERNFEKDINEENMNNHRITPNQPNDMNDKLQNDERNERLKPNNRNMNDQRP